MPRSISLSRRDLVRGMSFGAALWMVPGLLAEELTKTPMQTEGPFYPTKLPLDTDNDLLILNDSTTPGNGEVAYVSGRILDTKGNPLRNAVVEIWQADAGGAYLHPRSDNGDKRDKNFQGFGRFTTGSTGEYLFRTIKPVPYPGRVPHIHFGVKIKGKKAFSTQLYIKGFEGNDKDRVYLSAGDAKMRDLIAADFAPIKESKVGELAAKFDIVLGVTPEQG